MVVKGGEKMNALRYEHFVRSAFETKERYETQNWDPDSILVERGEDPARLSEAGLFNTQLLSSRVKIATAYAMEVYSSLFKNHGSINLSQQEYNRMETIIDDVVNAGTHSELTTLIQEYQGSFVGPYVPLLQQS